MKSTVCVIILNWNNLNDTISCLQSLRKMSYANYEVVVVDNGSSDESIAVLEKVSGIHLIKNKDNLGFSGGNNVAMNFAVQNGFNYVWLINSDAIVEPDCLEKIILAVENDSKIGLVSPVIYHKDRPEEIQHCGTRLNAELNGVNEAADIDIAKTWQDAEPHNVILWGTALLINTALIKKIGYLDEQLFAYSEDTDYSMRSSKAGFRNITIFDAKIWHQSTIGFRKAHFYYYTSRNVGLMWRKYSNKIEFVKICWWNFHRTARHIKLMRQHPDLATASKLGLWDGWMGNGGAFDPSRKLPLFPKILFQIVLN